MEMFPIDLTAIVAIVMGMLIVLIPVAGLTARFAFKPIAEAIVRMRETQGRNQEISLLEKRVSLLEQQLNHMETSVGRLEEERDFQRKLTSPQP